MSFHVSCHHHCIHHTCTTLSLTEHSVKSVYR
jgi:hypothetical protein